MSEAASLISTTVPHALLLLRGNAQLRAVWQGRQHKRIAAVFAARGAKHTKSGLELNRSSPHKFRLLEGQVGQESNLQPAVLEFASFRPLLFVHVHRRLNFTDFCPTVCRLVSACVAHGLLSELLSIVTRVLWEFLWPTTVSHPSTSSEFDFCPWGQGKTKPCPSPHKKGGISASPHPRRHNRTVMLCADLTPQYCLDCASLGVRISPQLFPPSATIRAVATEERYYVLTRRLTRCSHPGLHARLHCRPASPPDHTTPISKTASPHSCA